MALTLIKKWQIENLQIVDADISASAAISISKIANLQAELDGKEDAFSKNTAFNKNFGTTAGTVAEGDHVHDASDITSGVFDIARIPALDISNITGLQTALNGKEDAFTKNTAFNKDFGTTAGTVSEGNHTHTFASITSKPTTLSGYGITDAYTQTQIDSFLSTKANDADVVKLTGNQTIGGIKTFTSIPVLPATNPTTANQATRKGYVDGLVGTLSTLNTVNKSNLVNAINEIWTDYVPESRQLTVGNGLTRTAGTDMSTDFQIDVDFDYMDQRYLTGLKDHEVVRLIVDENVALSGLQTIQSVTLVAGDRVLLISQTDGSENGAYTAASGAWIRTADFDTVGPGEVEQGARFGATEGDFVGSQYTLGTAGTIILGTTDLEFFQSNAGATYTPGTGIEFVGSQINARTTEALWNAVELRNEPIASITPTINQLLQYNGSSWIPWTPTFAQSSDLNNYYTKTNLQTSGQASVHWENITNTPTTLQGYGITNAFPVSYNDAAQAITFSGNFQTLPAGSYTVTVGAEATNKPWGTAGGSMISFGGGIYSSRFAQGYGGDNLWFSIGNDLVNDVYYQVASREWVNSLAGVAQTLSLGTTSGTIIISGGNNVTLSSIDITGVVELNDKVPTRGLYPILHTTGSTGFPAALGGGIQYVRTNATTAGAFIIDKNVVNDGKLQFNVGTSGTSWKGWETFASEEFVSDGYLPLSGGTTTGNVVMRAGDSPLNISAGSSAAYIRFTQSDGSTQKGYIGFTASDPNSMFITNSGASAFVRIGNSGGESSLQYSYGDGFKTIWHAGNLDPGNYMNLNRKFQNIFNEDFNDLLDGSRPFITGQGSNILDANQFTGAAAFYGNLNLSNSAVVNGMFLSFIGTTYGFQLQAENGNVSEDVWVRNTVAGTGTTAEGTWRKLWHSGNLTPIDAAKYIVREQPSGIKNGTNTIFTLANTPTTNKEMIFFNGQLLNPGGTNDYTIDDDTITLSIAPLPDDIITVTYIY